MCPVQDVDTSTTCYTVDSMKGICRGPQLLSQTSQHFSDTKKTGANLLKETHVIREPIRFTNSKSSPFHELLTLPSTTDLRDSLVPQLQDSRNSTRRKRKAETDTINITNFSVRKPFTGVASCPLIKDLLLGQSPVKSQAIGEEIGEIRSRKTDRNISDRKQQAFRLLAAEDSIQNRALSTSLTETLDVENFYSYVEQPEKHNFNFPQNAPFVQQNMSWVKRLKLGEPYTSSLGSKRSELGDFSSGDRVNELYCKIIENSDNSSSDLILNRFPDEGQMEMGRGTVLLNNRDSISLDLAGKCQHLFLSHPWIQRWCQKSQQMKPTTPVTREPENWKATMDEFQPKKLPSIAAMALVGKATSSRLLAGSVMIWNIEGIR
ncbi:hypothetical protein FRX31_029212 [Thalictrum thalictroides]|uniref:F-box protein n=1 Tax=Thalictrum thalictroides TaxID=46969 RepID=A0A7J6V7V4_THATH|nr:hypothetical protein FRX31_029212 [Thalictrum thalictroides]